MRISLFLCSFYLIMFTLAYSQNITNTITVLPDNQVVTNMQTRYVKGSPLESDIKKNISLPQNKIFSINVNATNLDRYIRITDFSTNIDFIRFTRDKTNALLTFTTLNPGIATLNFQVDNEENVIRKYFYTITITNVVSTNSVFNLVDTNALYTITNSVVAKSSTAISNMASSDPIINTDLKKSSVDTKNTNASKEIIDLFNMAEDLKKSRDYSNAVSAYSNVISSFPDSEYGIYSYFRIADIYNYNKDYMNAFSIYEKLSIMTNINDVQKASSLYSMGVVRKSENNYGDAMSYFSKVMNIYSNTPLSANASFEYADSLRRLGRMSDGLDILNKAVEKDKNFAKRPLALLLLAEIYEKGNSNIRDYRKAYNIYNQYLKEYPNGTESKYANDRALFISRNFLNLR